MRGFGQMGQMGQRYTDPRRKFSQQLMDEGISTAPVQHWTQGLGRMAKMLLGMKMQQQLGGEAQGRQSGMTDFIRENFSNKVIDQPATTTQGPDIYPEATNFAQSGPGTGPLTGDVAPDPIPTGFSPDGVPISLDDAERQLDNQTVNASGQPGFRPGPAIQPEPPIPGAITNTPEQSHQELGKFGKLLMTMNQNQYGGVDPGMLMAGMIRQDDRKYSEGLAEKKYQRGRTDKATDAQTKFGYDKELAGIRSGNMTTDQKNWEYAKNNPGFKDFLTATGQSNTPKAVQEYEYFSKLNADQQTQFLTVKRANTSINFGGYQGTQDPANPAGPLLANRPKTLPPQDTPQHKADVKTFEKTAEYQVELEKERPQAETLLRNMADQVGDMDYWISQAQIEAEAFWATGGLGAVADVMPWETPASRLGDYLTTIKANLGFDKLQAMRNASKTGGALGQVSEIENELLQAVNGALNAKNETVLKKNLAIVKKLYPGYRRNLKAAYKTRYGREFVYETPQRRKFDQPDAVDGKTPQRRKTDNPATSNGGWSIKRKN